MRTWILSTAAVGLFAISGAASAGTCTDGSTTVTVDGASDCVGGIIAGNVGGTTFPPDWTQLEKDNIGEGGEGDGFLRITLDTASSGTWMYTGMGTYSELLLLVKFGNSYTVHNVTGMANTSYDWSIVPNQGNGLSHMQLFGRGTTSVPEPTALALLGLGLAGLGFARRRRSK